MKSTNATGAKTATSKNIEMNFCQESRLQLDLVNSRGEKRLTISFRDEYEGRQAEINVYDANGNTVTHLAAFNLDGFPN